MTVMVWQGRSWELTVPGPTAARHFAAMGKARGSDAVGPMLDLLDLILGAEQVAVLEDGITDGQFPTRGFADLLTDATHHLSGRPLVAVVALSGSAVSQWSIIRGRLVRDGITNPLRDLPTLWALLDAVEWMILESKKDEKETDDYWRSLYPAETEWSDDEEAASAEAFFGAFGG